MSPLQKKEKREESDQETQKLKGKWKREVRCQPTSLMLKATRAEWQAHIVQREDIRRFQAPTPTVTAPQAFSLLTAWYCVD